MIALTPRRPRFSPVPIQPEEATEDAFAVGGCDPRAVVTHLEANLI